MISWHFSLQFDCRSLTESNRI